MSDQIPQLSVKELFEENVHYVIPMYQRNYAWDEAEITQLIQDVIDYQRKGGGTQNYYIGTLVVFARSYSGNTVYETIDGQQRLTTLSLLLSHLRNSRKPGLEWYDTLRIRFESRERSQKTFSAIFSGALDKDPNRALAEQDTNASIVNGYRLIQKILPAKLEESDVDPEDFISYLLEHVVLMRACVPPHTDLNHYFEIMNSRGEQLEKHEVLKARMMEALSKNGDAAQSQQCLHVVWEACANMERYVQLGFTPDERDAVFGKNDWGRLAPTNFPELCAALSMPAPCGEAQRVALTLDQILEPAKLMTSATPATDRKDGDAPERFHSVINFPNFLLHVLRVMTGESVSLDDKILLEEFEEHVFKAANSVQTIEKFVFALLRCKYLFDHYVIKREFVNGTDGWSLKRLKWNAPSAGGRTGRLSYVNTFGIDDEVKVGADDARHGDNKRILMLLAAFHVSTPTRVYKYWLYAALKHLYDKGEQGEAYLYYLESVAKAFVFDRYLAGDDKAAYHEIIHVREGKVRARPDHFENEPMMASRLSYGRIENNLIFNYLDYLLWLKYRTKEKIRDFEFTFRSSVEHYYPQNPMEGQEPLEDQAALNSFGNLCLISHSKNSRLSNLPPSAKHAYYEGNSIDSVKQYLMMESDPRKWGIDAIRVHGKEMTEVLLDSLEPQGASNDVALGTAHPSLNHLHT